MEPSNSDSVEKLNELLRGEISAIETYAQVLEKIESPFIAREDLMLCHAAHQARAGLLTKAITNLHGEPVATSGVWGTFAKVVEGGAKMFGANVAVSALEEGENYGLKLYEESLEVLDVASRTFVERELLPGQQESQRCIKNVKLALSA